MVGKPMKDSLLDNITDFIKPLEALRLKSYRLRANGNVDVWTIGYGTTRNVKEGMEITPQVAEMYLKNDILSCLLSLYSLVKVNLNDNQVIALVDFIYNLGAGALQCSTLLIKLNRSEYENAAQQFIKWNHFHGLPLKGLTKRRLLEKQLFML